MLGLLIILFALAPTYAWRFSLDRIPTNFLELLVAFFWLAFVIWLIATRRVADFISFLKSRPRLLIILMAAFFIAGLISTGISPNRNRGLGLFLVLFIQPLITFFFANYLLQNEQNKKRFVNAIFIAMAALSAYAIYQYFTLKGLPPEWQGNANEPKRALSVFEHPNDFALWLAPLLAFCLPFVFKKSKFWQKICYFVGLIGLLISLSRGAWIGFAIAVLLFAILSQNKKIRIAIAAGLAIFALLFVAVPNLRYRVLLPFEGEKSTVSRYSLWHTANKMIKDSPLLGKGLYGFKTYFDKYNTDPGLQSHTHAHNIALTLWVETGILGMVSFALICIYLFVYSWQHQTIYSLGLILFLVAMLAHGTVDTPYLKNDLALVFWLIAALAI